MRTPTLLFALAAAVPLAASAQEQPIDPASAMHWRNIGPSRSGRARALAGVPAAPGRPAALYAGFDNGGVWRTTDYGANWVPLFDAAPTGSIGAIGIAPSNTGVIYVGSGAGIIRPDLAVGNGMYKSTDTGRTWTHIGLDATQMIAYVDVDPTNPDRLFVAALGHPYGPNADRGIFRSTDGGRSWAKVLYKDEYTSANDVHIDPSNPQVVYAALWQQQQAFWEGGDFSGGSGGVFKSTDGGTTWTQLTDGLPQVLEANLAIAPSNPQVVYAMVASVGPPPRGGSGPVALYRSDDGGAHFVLKTRMNASQGDSSSQATTDPRPLGRIGGGDLPPITVDPSNPDVVYSASIVMYRTEDAGRTWSAVRGAPGGDDYQRIWVSPNDPALILAVSDQGAVVSANRGLSWSNWYNQSTAAVYHTTTDNAYPYRVCSGQQDSGSLCVASRSDDGEITFHDWHPVNIQEYGMAAPDPRDPDVVFGSARTGVSRYDRRTGQTTQVGPGADQRGDQFNRNVRTMPLVFSARADALYYASNAVWKSLDRGHTWTRISGDLTRGSDWSIPPSAGKYATTIQASSRGAITALALSPRNPLVIWAGSDDGAINVTTNGGASWTAVTPPEIQAWTRIYNMDAGHFDAQTAYAAANTLRIDDMRPHVFRTHDGGHSWTEISTGIDSGAVVNTVREDPRVPGLLYAGTDTQVWVSFDDGGHWQSLRLDMPAISVRDLAVKDDSLCGCADLIAGTHGRGFWILDDLTPLRQRAEIARAQQTSTPYLVKPLVATRVRFGTNEPTPWPPELPAGENPPDGAVIDYYLPQEAQGRVTLEILDAAGKVVRSYASDDTIIEPDPAVNPELYNRVCQRMPNASHCGLPLYWPAPQQRLSAKAGMHRFTWDMRWQPLPVANPAVGVEVDATGAVPHRSRPSPTAPWAPAGRYTVRLTVNGTAYTQPLALRLDPRVKLSAAAQAQLAALSRRAYDALLPLPQGRPRQALLRAMDAIQDADVAPTAAQVAAIEKAIRDAANPQPAAPGNATAPRR